MTLARKHGSPYFYDEDGCTVEWADRQAEMRYWGVPHGKVWTDWKRSQNPRIVKGQAVIQEIKERLNIVEVAEHYRLEVKTRGRYHMIRCPDPEHDDKNPSCCIWPDINAFKCFACGAKGDVLEFIRLLEASQ